jgi:SAM-dependent methyltransferase
MTDDSNGYDQIADVFIAARGARPAGSDSIGAAVVRTWAEAFPPGATILDLGAGSGDPGARLLHDAGLTTYAIDASPKMVAAFRDRFPGVPIEQNTVEASDFFGRTFDGVIAWGLLFLLEPAAQAHVIGKVGRVLTPGGRFLFTAPAQRATWSDAMTGRQSESLGAEVYDRLLQEAGMRRVGEARDEGENHYYFAEKQ